MQQAGAYNLTSYYPLGLSGGGLFQWQNTTTLTPDGGTVIAPANNPGSCSQGCMIRQLSPPNEISPEFFGARCRQIAADGTVDTSGMLAAVAAAHNNGYLSIKTKGVCALNSTIDLSNFSQTINIDLGGVIEGSTFPPIPSWTGATSFFTIGGSGGGQVSINLSIGYTTGLDADVIHITGPGSAGGSKFFVGYASQVNGVIYVYGNTSPVSVNQFAGNYWIGCVNPNINSCGNFGILLYPGAQPAESNIVSTNWISNFDYGGVIEGNGASFTSFLGAMESNGQWDSQICSTGTITGFALGDTVAQGVSRGIVLSPSYTYQNHFCIAVQETKNVSSSRSNFTVGQVLTDGANSFTIFSILTVNQVTNPESFDIVSNNPNPTQDIIHAPYLGGKIGPNIPTDIVIGTNQASTTTCLKGVGVSTTGGTINLGNCAIDPTQFPLRIGGNSANGVPLSNSGGTGFLIAPTTGPGLIETRVSGASSITGTADLALDGMAAGAAGPLYLNHYSTGATEIGGGGGPITMPSVNVPGPVTGTNPLCIRASDGRLVRSTTTACP